MGRSKRTTQLFGAAMLLLLMCVCAQLQGACCAVAEVEIGGEGGSVGGGGGGRTTGGSKGINPYSSSDAADVRGYDLLAFGKLILLALPAGLVIWGIAVMVRKVVVASRKALGVTAAVRTPVVPPAPRLDSIVVL
ncbi:unnamed protein product [Urochloa humidicola]